VSVDQTARIEGVIKAHLKKISMGQPYGYAVGYGFGPVFDNQGQPMGMGWMWAVLVSIPNPLVGMNDIAASVPAPGVLPSDAVFRQVAEFLYHKCVDEREKLTAIPADASMALSEKPA
jgi:hypothetical protein